MTSTRAPRRPLTAADHVVRPVRPAAERGPQTALHGRDPEPDERGAPIKALAVTATAAVAVAAGLTAARHAPAEDAPPIVVTTTKVVTVTSTYRGRPASAWAARFRHRTRQLQAARLAALDARRSLLRSPSVVEAVNLSCALFGSCSTLWRKAECESHLDVGARNPSGASGLFQFLPSTFASTPFGRFSIWSPYANALAAGWMHAHGRGGEWECR